MKILLLSPLPPPKGGIATWTQIYMNSSIAKDNEIDIINTGIIGKRREEFVEKNIVDEIKRAGGILRNLINKLRREKYDLVHINLTTSFMGMSRDFLLVSYMKIKRQKIVLHFHCDVQYMIKSNIQQLLFKSIVKCGSEVLCLNRFSRDYVFKVTQKNAKIVPNFFPEKDIDSYDKKINDGIKKIVFVGHVVLSKGCAEIVEVAKKLPNIEFKMIGYISKDVKDISNIKNVILTGEISRDEVLNEMKSADLFLFPTYTEGFPNVVLEAMASGLPIIATDVGAIPDMLEDKGGIIVNVKDTKAILKAIERIQDANIREKMSKWNKQKVLDVYTTEKVCGILKYTYEGML